MPAAPKWELRGMTGYEEEVAERRRNDVNTAALCNEIIARCLVAPGADYRGALEFVRAMLIARRDEALIRVRQLSLGDELSSIVTCPACKKQNDVSFKLSSLPIDIGQPPEQVEVRVDKGKRAVMRLPNAGDQESLLQQNLDSESAKRTWLLARVLIAYGDQQGPFDYEFVHALPVAERRKLETELERVVPDLDLTMELSCSECRHPFRTAFDVGAFFLPR